MAALDEHTLPGGIYWEGRDGPDDDEQRTDVSVTEVGTGEPDNPYVLSLNITTGNGTYTLCSVTPDDMRRLARWLIATTKEIKRSRT